jgi:ribose transport system permease protein
VYFVFVHTRFGATVRAIGSNPVAAEFIVQNKSHSCLRDCASGPASGFFWRDDVGLLQGGRHLFGAQPRPASYCRRRNRKLAGGSGTIIGAALGVLIITTIDSGLVFYGANLNYSEFVTGAVIIGAIALDRISKRCSSP